VRTSFVDRTGKGAGRLRGWRSFLQSCARRLEVGKGELTVLLCGDEEMASLNRRFRGREGTTDVLSFPGHELDPEGGLHLGDVAVSVERAELQASEAGWDLDHEVRRLLAHGLLHVLGYDHETDQGEMEALEKDLLRALLAAPGER
jgi:probable rRNA maturation factor